LIKIDQPIRQGWSGRSRSLEVHFNSGQTVTEGGEVIAFARFVSEPVVRIILAILGVELIMLGFFGIGRAAGTLVGMIGFVPLVAEVVDFCLIGPLGGGHFDGR